MRARWDVREIEGVSADYRTFIVYTDWMEDHYLSLPEQSVSTVLRWERDGTWEVRSRLMAGHSTL